MSSQRATTAREQRIEQAAARGLTPHEIAAAVGAPMGVVDAVLNRMDQIHRPAPVGRPRGEAS